MSAALVLGMKQRYMSTKELFTVVLFVVSARDTARGTEVDMDGGFLNLPYFQASS